MGLDIFDDNDSYDHDLILEAEELIADLEQQESRLTQGDVDFIDRIASWIESGTALTEAQVEALRNIKKWRGI